MNRISVKISVALILLGLSACSPQTVEEAVMAEPVVFEDSALKGMENECGSAVTDAGDGIGGTGCKVD